MTRLSVTSLKLSHVRSYGQALVEPDVGPIAIYGANGAGKTNLLEAVSLLSPGRGMRRAKPEEIARAPAGIGWRITAELDTPEEPHSVVTGALPGANRTVTIDEKTAPQTALGRLARVIWLVPVMDRLWVDGAAERRGFLDRIALSLDPSHGASVLAYEKAMRERNRLFRDDITDANWFSALEAQMAKAGAAVTAARGMALARIAAAQETAETSFPAAELSLTETGPAAEEDLAEALAASRSRDAAAGRTLIGPHRADLSAVYAEKAMEARLCSTGEQKALLVSLILSNARAIASDFGAPPILLLDEIAAHLDADRRAALYDEIIAIRAQAWLTGTGRELFEALEGRAGFLCASEGPDGTVLEWQ